jgi:hypothetical protein
MDCWQAMCYPAGMNIVLSTVETAEKTTKETIEVAPGVDVVRITVERRTGTEETCTVGECVVHRIDTQDEHFGEFRIVAPELLERLRLKGWFHDDKDWELVIKEPFQHVLTGKPYTVVRLKTWDNSVYDAGGLRLPVGVHFSYIDGRVNDYSFNLNGLLKHLEGRSDVTLHTERFSDHPIHRIPSYNAGDTCGYHGMSFTWHPNSIVFRQYVAAAAKMDHFDRRAAAHTLMGNDQFRIEPPKEDCDECVDMS